jgi:hypothetical protein
MYDAGSTAGDKRLSGRNQKRQTRNQPVEACIDGRLSQAICIGNIISICLFGDLRSLGEQHGPRFRRTTVRFGYLRTAFHQLSLTS